MKRLAFVAALVALSLPVAAHAKGATKATITGPGLDQPIVLAGRDNPAAARLLESMAQHTGFFAAVFGQTPDPMLYRRPTGTLGPRYRITYFMPGPNGRVDRIVQALYPYARPGPVSYMRPGQRYFGNQRTRGGWYVAPYGTLKRDLVAAGLPRTPPA